MGDYIQNTEYRYVKAVLYQGSMESLKEIAKFTGLPPHDIYSMSIDWGIMCVITGKDGNKVRLNPGEYLVKIGDELMAIPANCFEKLYMKKEG